MRKIDWPKTFSNMMVVLSGVFFFYFLTNYTTFASVASGFFKAFSPFIWAFVFAYILNPVVNFFEEQAKEMQHARAAGIAMTFMFVVIIAGMVVSMLIPQLVDSVRLLFTNLPGYVQELGRLLTSLGELLHLQIDGAMFMQRFLDMLPTDIMGILESGLGQAVNTTMAVGRWVLNLLISLVACIYMLAEKNVLKRQAKKAVRAIVPLARIEQTIELCHRMNYIFSRFMVGKIIDSAIIGMLCLLFMLVMGLEYALLISVVVAITNVVPFFGPFIGAIPGVVLLFIVDPFQAFAFLVLIIALQQFDGNILGPAILGDSLGISALWILFAIMVGGSLFGFAGMLLGVPAFAFCYGLASEFVDDRIKKRAAGEKALPEEHEPPVKAGQAPGEQEGG